MLNKLISKLKKLLSNNKATKVNTTYPAPVAVLKPVTSGPGSLKYYFDLYSMASVRTTPEIQDRVAYSVKKLLAGRARYEVVESATGVPWFVVGSIHGKECSFKWDCGLLNGQPWNRVTTIVPKGKGPFKSWEEAAIYAMRHQKADQIKNWSLEVILQWSEKYNGLGYMKNHPEVKSPYIWDCTTLYSKGKYVADGVFDPNAVSKGVGIAAILKVLESKEVIKLNFDCA